MCRKVMVALMLAVVVTVGLGSCSSPPPDPRLKGRNIVDEHAATDGVVGSYVRHDGGDDSRNGTGRPTSVERVSGGWMLLLAMDQVLGLRVAARDFTGSPDHPVLEEPSGNAFTVDRSWFANMGGHVGAVEDGYFDLGTMPSDHYLVCHGKRIDEDPTAYRVVRCARDIALDPPAALDVQRLDTNDGAFRVVPRPQS